MNGPSVVLRAVVLAGYAAAGVAGAVLLSEYTIPGADLGTYQRAGADWLALGDPYASSSLFNSEFQYRYPPLLAMLMPLLGWPPLWFALMAIATAVPIWFAYRDGGPFGLLPALLLVGAWGQTLVNGNVQPVVIALLVLTPRFQRAGAVCLAFATMLKLFPALGVVWYLGRRDWVALRWYAAGLVALTVVQGPWLGTFVDYYLNDPAATSGFPGMPLIRLGVVPWVIGVTAVGFVTYRYANTRYGWLFAQILQLVFLPRLFAANLALVLAAPIPAGDGDRPSLVARAATAIGSLRPRPSRSIQQG